MTETQKSLECPFTWKIDENLARKFDESEELVVEVEEQPVLAFMNSIALAYFKTVQKNHDGAFEALTKSQMILDQINPRKVEKDEISFNVLLHIMKATEYHLHTSLNKNSSDAKSIIEDITDSKTFRNKSEIGTINGSKSIVWSSFHDAGCQQVIPLAEIAISNCPNCSLWHYILGKNLRYYRRNIDGLQKPSWREKKMLLKCYQLSPIPFYGIHVAQMYREDGDKNKSKKIYLEIYESRPINAGINLRLSRAFTVFNQLDKAEACLEMAGRQNKNNLMYLHYKGCLYRKQKKLEEAAYYFKKAAETGNYHADIDYADVMTKLDKINFDYLNHLQMMIEKYDNKNCKQMILLHIAMQYYYKKYDWDNTISNLLKAIQIDPKSKQLKDFKNITIDWNQQINIFDFISVNLLPKYCGCPLNLSADVKIGLEALKNICKEQGKSSNNELIQLLEKVNL